MRLKPNHLVLETKTSVRGGNKMLTYQSLYPIIQSVAFHHPLFEAYHIQFIPLKEKNQTQYILKIENLVLLVEQSHPNIKTGTVKVLSKEENPKQNPQTLYVGNQTYRVTYNLALLTPEQEKEFKKEYKHALHQFKKALKDYEKLSKKQQKAAIKTARQVEILPQA